MSIGLPHPRTDESELPASGQGAAVASATITVLGGRIADVAYCSELNLPDGTHSLYLHQATSGRAEVTEQDWRDAVIYLRGMRMTDAMNIAFYPIPHGGRGAEMPMPDVIADRIEAALQSAQEKGK